MKSRPEDPTALRVSEVFETLAGETTHAGLPAVFVRLTGCNLRCRWCDTSRAWDGGRVLPIDELVEVVASRGRGLVVVTGGEPLAQAGTPALCRQLLERGARVLVETNGSLDISALPPGASIILDMKPPSSGESERMDEGNLQRLRDHDELKIVIADPTDFRWALELLDRHPGLSTGRVLFSPLSPGLSPGALADWILASKREIRLQLQLHKILWPDGRDGVPIFSDP
jgi:7-carboxy-7-deazaguanine synthase